MNDASGNGGCLLHPGRIYFQVVLGKVNELGKTCTYIQDYALGCPGGSVDLCVSLLGVSFAILKFRCTGIETICLSGKASETYYKGREAPVNQWAEPLALS